MIIGRLWRLMPISDISARIPPSPSLSMRIATVTYLMVVMIVRVQMMSDKEPNTISGSGLPPASAYTLGHLAECLCTARLVALPEFERDDRFAKLNSTDGAQPTAGLRGRIFDMRLEMPGQRYGKSRAFANLTLQFDTPGVEFYDHLDEIEADTSADDTRNITSPVISFKQ